MTSLKKRKKTNHIQGGKGSDEKCNKYLWCGSKFKIIEFFTQSDFHVTNYCGISVGTVTKIRKEGTEAAENSLTTPRKKRIKKNINFIATNLTKG